MKNSILATLPRLVFVAFFLADSAFAATNNPKTQHYVIMKMNPTCLVAFIVQCVWKKDQNCSISYKTSAILINLVHCFRDELAAISCKRFPTHLIMS